MVRAALGCNMSTFQAMNNQRHEGVLCDVKITVDDGLVFAHKAVLAACSPYFHTMFTGGFREGDSPIPEVDMSKVFPDLSTAEHVIQSMYTDHLDVTRENVYVLYNVFSFLLFDKPKMICEDFMSNHLSWDTCIEYWQATHYHNLSGDLHKTSANLLENRFHDHFIDQECLLNVSNCTVSILLEEHIFKLCSPKQILTFLIKWFLKSNLTDGNILKKLIMEAYTHDLVLPAMSNFRSIMDEIQSSMAMTRFNRQAIAKVCDEIHPVDQDSKIPTDIFINSGYDRAVDVVHRHMPVDILQETGRLDVVLAIAPGLAKTQDENNAPRSGLRLRLFAYVRRVQLWVDLGFIGYPKTYGSKNLFSESHFYAAGNNLFLLYEKRFFLSRMPWSEWQEIMLPSNMGGRQVGLYPLQLNSMMYVILIEDVYTLCEGIRGVSRPFKGHSIILGMITNDGQWERIIQRDEGKESRKNMFGPCWVEQSCFLVQRWTSEPFHHCDFMLLNPDRKDIRFVESNTEGIRPMGNLGTRPYFLEQGGWMHVCDEQSDDVANSRKVVLRFRLNDKQSYVAFEEPADSIAFKNSLESEFLSSQIWVTSGPCLWRISNMEKGNSFLHELYVQQPDVEIEHTPPPCNVILAAAATTMDSEFLSNQPLARYLHICDPAKEENTTYDSDESSDSDYTIVNATFLSRHGFAGNW